MPTYKFRRFRVSKISDYSEPFTIEADSIEEAEEKASEKDSSDLHFIIEDVDVQDIEDIVISVSSDT